MPRFISVALHRQQFRNGLLFAALAVIMPIVLTEGHFGIYRSMLLSATEGDFGHMMIAVAKLLIMNCIRTTPSYLGAIVISEAVEIHLRDRRWMLLKVLLAIGVIRIIYTLIFLTSGIYYDLGVPAVVTVVIITLLTEFGLFSVSTLNKGIMIALIIIDMQCLTAYPPLSGFGFGRGEISVDIKNFSKVLGFEGALVIFSALMFSVMVLCTLIVIKLINDEQRLTQSIARQRQVEEELSETRYNALMLRTYSEIQHLVHDLKTPLTTVQGLANLAEMRTDDNTIREYGNRISLSVDNMNAMISEILHENQKAPVPIREIMSQVAAYMAGGGAMSRMVNYPTELPDAWIMANRTRLTRAIINVIENAATAAYKARGDRGRVDVEVFCEDGEVRVVVTDNGTGIDPMNLGRVWQPGYSTSQSTGLGLAFIRSVVENHGGQIVMDSEVMAFTRVALCFEEVNACLNQPASP